MSEKIDDILSRFESLTAKEQSELADALSSHFGKEVRFSHAGLSELGPEKLEIVNGTVGGMLLTKKHVPDMIETHVKLADADLPKRIAFGRSGEGES
ncbi:hypothetical protein [Cohnella algarum]|uniref:hypothetical protein n=1 Tax=Cohnella algarum TaxID=2044859 RepID=UPI001967A03F|nr:hypothetical protein [Cohnella algarum]MBN2982119.1 hypothetical protein [Cohnella algarum]